MPSPVRVTFVLVPGPFVVPEEYDKIEALLREAGHKSKTIDLLSANETRQPPATTAEDITHLRNGLLESSDGGSNVVLALHSYAGIPGTSAVEWLDAKSRASVGKNTTVLGILYMTFFMPDVGESVRGISVKFDSMPEPFLTGNPGGYMAGISADFAPAIFNGVPDSEEVKRYHGMMVQHSGDAYSGEATYAGWKDIPSTLILPGTDKILPVTVQEWMFERAEKFGVSSKKRFVENAGHMTNVSQPEVVVEELVKLAGL